MANILVLHGPNLNMLGVREPAVYGQASLQDIDDKLLQLANSLGHQLSHQQSNAEHELVTAVQQAATDNIDFILINPAAFTHTSIAIRDALLAVDIPFIEVHLSNIFQRESFRQHSLMSDIAQGIISGFGAYSYELALHAANKYLANQP